MIFRPYSALAAGIIRDKSPEKSFLTAKEADVHST